MALGLGAVLTSTAQAVAVPRLVTTEGLLERRALAFMAFVTCISAVAFAVVIGFAGQIGRALAGDVQVGSPELAAALRWACAFLFLQVIASQLITVSLALGGRFIAAVAPGLPSLAGAALLAATTPSVRVLYLALAAGAMAEVILVGVSLRRRARVVNGPPLGVHGIAILTALQFALLNVIPPLERAMASTGGNGGAAHYNYALRSLAIVQQLLIGGFVLAALGDWSALAREGDAARIRSAVARTVVVAATLLSLAASVAVVAGRDVVTAVYEHGAFHASDTSAVNRLLLIAIVGFWAEGVGLVLSQALIARRRNDVAVGIGLGRFALQGCLIFALGRSWGAPGVAGAYSIAAGVTLVVQAVAARRVLALRRADIGPFGRVSVVGIGTLASAAVVAAVAGGVPALAQLACVVTVFALLVVHIGRQLPELIRDVAS
jgi:peptidoglycan biosynthesis protein MviN/MurJ (putative lipid II flippase)